MSGYLLVIDDHPLARAGLAEFLRGLENLEVRVASGEWGLLERLFAQHGAPRLAVIDVWLGAHPGGLDMLASLRRRAPGLPVLVISGDERPELQARARAAGAAGFLGKREDPAIFRAAIECLLRGGAWFPAVGARTAGAAPQELPVTPAELGLTPRQGDVLALMLDGLPNKRIACALGLSEATVKEHVAAILDRLNATSRVEVLTRLRGRRLVHRGVPV